ATCRRPTSGHSRRSWWRTGSPTALLVSRSRASIGSCARTGRSRRRRINEMSDYLLPTTVIGSYPQPDWLIDRAMLKDTVPRVRLRQLWRVAEPYLAQAQDDATLVAICDMERAGIDIITDGEIRRESYSNRFATALEGIDTAKPGHVKARSGHQTPVPRVVAKIRRTRAVEVRDMQFLRRNTERTAKINLPCPSR